MRLRASINHEPEPSIQGGLHNNKAIMKSTTLQCIMPELRESSSLVIIGFVFGKLWHPKTQTTPERKSITRNPYKLPNKSQSCAKSKSIGPPILASFVMSLNLEGNFCLTYKLDVIFAFFCR
jgi:hypothetical protein